MERAELIEKQIKLSPCKSPKRFIQVKKLTKIMTTLSFRLALSTHQMLNWS